MVRLHSLWQRTKYRLGLWNVCLPRYLGDNHANERALGFVTALVEPSGLALKVNEFSMISAVICLGSWHKTDRKALGCTLMLTSTPSTERPLWKLSWAGWACPRTNHLVVKSTILTTSSSTCTGIEVPARSRTVSKLPLSKRCIASSVGAEFRRVCRMPVAPDHKHLQEEQQSYVG